MRHTIPTVPWRATTTWSITPRNLVPLIFGLSVFGFGEGLLVLSHLGASPWSVFALGLAKVMHLSVGWTTLLISAAVMLLWIPLHEKPGFGTIANIAIIAGVLGVTVLLPAPHALVVRVLLIVIGIECIGLGSALYITTGLGPGPRDGLMTSLHRRTGISVVYIRLSIEVTVVVLGWLLGGTVGLGTVAFAACIGFALGVNLVLVQTLAERRS